MKKLKAVWALAVLYLCTLAGAENPGPPVPAEAVELPAGSATLHKFELLKKIVPKFGRMEVRAEVEAAGLNPFDPEEVRVDLLLKSPSGIRKVAPGFYMAPKTGEALGADWRVRFSPDEEGEWDAELVVTTADGSKDSESFEFECNTPALPAPIRVSKDHPEYFETTDGKFFYPLGQNVCWGSLKDYEHHFSKMHQNGENWSRIWIAAWNVEIEWSNAKPGFRGLGKYHLENAAKLDRIMELADSYGIHLQMVLHEHCRIATVWNPEWRNNPYNKARGGPCEKPQDFFTNPEALQLTRNRIRYIIARWGYSTRVMAWELFNEVNLGDDYNPTTDTAWHRDMAQYIRKTDPQGRMVTTSYAGELNKEVFALPEIDFAQVHLYDEAIVEKLIESMMVFADYKKPYFIGEFGRNTKDGVDRKDKKGMVLHSGIWAQFMMPSGGNAMSWWWYDLIKPSNLYYRFGTLSAFSTGIDRRKGNWNWQYGGLTKDPQSPRVLSMASARTIMFWIYDPKILPYVEKMPESMPDIEGEIVIENISPGNWLMEKWEPFNSHVPTREGSKKDQVSSDGKLTVKIKALGPDCAYKLELPSKERADESRLPSLKLEPWEGGAREALPRAKLSIPKRTAPVMVDGDLSDWAQATYTTVESKDGAKVEDRSFRFAVAHDDTHLYVVWDVKDDELIRQNKGSNLWKDDCVELWIDTLRTATKFKNMPNNPHLYQINLAPAATEDGTVDVSIYRNPNPSEPLRQSIRAISKKSPGGYVMEIAIPLAELRGSENALKPEMGINISICDSDKHGKKEPGWNHLVWQGEKEEDATQWSEATLE